MYCLKKILQSEIRENKFISQIKYNQIKTSINGSKNEIGRREMDIVKDLGFKTSTTTRYGNIYREHRNYLECLPRNMLTDKYLISEISKARRNRIVTL